MATFVTVRGGYRSATGGQASGSVTFRLTAPINDPAANLTYEPIPVTAVLSSGACSVSLLATHDLALTPTGVVYEVTEAIDNAPPRTWYLDVLPEWSPAGVEIADVAPAIPGELIYTYATKDDIEAHADAIDPHGDRAYTVAQLAAHTAAADPHGDRVYSDVALSAHNATTVGVHGIADTAALVTVVTTLTAAAVQAAIDAADTAGGGTVRLFPGATYPFGSTTVTFPVSTNKVLLDGQGAHVTYSGTGYAFDVSNGGATATWFKEIRNLDIVGTASGAGGVRYRGSLFGKLISNRIRGFTGAGAVCVLWANNTSGANYFTTVEGCDIREGAIGLSFESDANSNYILRNHFGIHATYAIQDAADTNVFTQNEFNGSITTAIRLLNGASGTKIVDNQFDGPTTGVSIQSSAVIGPTLSGNTGAPTVGATGTTTYEGPHAGPSLEPGFLLGGDASLYRYAAGILFSNAEVRVGNIARAGYNGSETASIGPVGPSGQGGLLLNADTNWYRSAADTMKTDDTLIAGAGHIYVGDLHLYKYSSGVMFADSEVRVGGVARSGYNGSETVSTGPVGPSSVSGVLFNADTNLYRSAADTLKTDDSLIIGANVGFYGTAAGAKPTVTGSRGGNAALASLLTALAGLGLITDSSTV